MPSMDAAIPWLPFERFSASDIRKSSISLRVGNLPARSGIPGVGPLLKEMAGSMYSLFCFIYSANLAALFILPSLNEGFGLPALEAMACGTPVACSNTSSLPEVVGEDAAVTFNPASVEDIAGAVVSILSDASLCSELSKRSVERARKFSWREAARNILEILESVKE